MARKDRVIVMVDENELETMRREAASNHMPISTWMRSTCMREAEHKTATIPGFDKE